MAAGRMRIGRGSAARATRLFLLVAATSAAVGCAGGDDGAGSPPSTALSMAQAQVLADSLFANYEAGGMTFALTAGLADGTTLGLRGEIDFAGHVGRAAVEATGVDAAVTEVVWTQTTVLEHRPALNERIAAAGRGSVTHVARPPDPNGRDLDAMLGVLMGLASTRPDNAVLVGQQEGSAWLRNDELRGVPVDVMRYGERSVYWLDSVTGAMLRFEGNTETGERPFVVDVLSLGRPVIPAIDQTAVVGLESVRDLYDAG